MIRIVVNPDLNPTTYSFEQENVIIGAHVPPAHLSLPGEELEALHIKITREGDKFVIINQAGDPFVSLNGLPFGKKVLKSSDLLQVGKTLLQLQIDPLVVESWGDTAHEIPKILEKAISPKDNQNPLAMTEGHFGEKNPLSIFEGAENDDEIFDIDELVRQVELLEETKTTAEESTTESAKEEKKNDLPAPSKLAELNAKAIAEKKEKAKEPLKESVKETVAAEPSISQEPLPKDADREEETIAHPHASLPTLALKSQEKKAAAAKMRQSLKDSHLSHLDDVSDSPTAPLERRSNRGKNKFDVDEPEFKVGWRFVGVLFFSLFLAAIAAAACFYVAVISKSEMEEHKAARSVADVSMALAYSRYYQVKPQNQNWTDPDFIKNNLAAILAPQFQMMANLDSQGHLKETPYLLRIYTSLDLSKFLVVAQPEPGLLQWLFPKGAIVVHSDSMELRRINDLRSLNRLLVNPRNLDGSNGNEILNFSQQGDLIPLTWLADRRSAHGFITPESLSYFRPGAENYIYNAPRYYLFGEKFLDRALELASHSGSMSEVAILQNQIAALSRFPDFILYSSQGLQAATEAQKALSTFIPGNKILTAYLQLSAKGKILNSHLLIGAHDPDGNKTGEIADALDSAQVLFHPPLALITEGVFSEAGQTFGSKAADEKTSDPLLLRLKAVAAERQAALKSSEKALMTVVAKNTQTPYADFESDFDRQSSLYLSLSAELAVRINEQVLALASEYSTIPLCEFLSKVEMAGLNVLKAFWASVAACSPWDE